MRSLEPEQHFESPWIRIRIRILIRIQSSFSFISRKKTLIFEEKNQAPDPDPQISKNPGSGYGSTNISNPESG